jgi:DNA-binding transcriptional MocR family regulator
MVNEKRSDNECWPGQKLLAKRARASRRAVQYALDELEARGLITRESQRRNDGYKSFDRYTVNVGAVPSLGAPVAPKNDLRRKSSTPQAQIQQVLGAPGAQQEPEEEPEEEPRKSQASPATPDSSLQGEEVPEQVGSFDELTTEGSSSSRATQSQKVFLRDNYLYLHLQPPDSAEEARWSSLSKDEADAEIKADWAEVESAGHWILEDARDKIWDLLSPRAHQYINRALGTDGKAS